MNVEIIDNYKIYSTVLGSGSFSTVFLGLQISTGISVAVKKIDLSKQKDLDRIMIEIDIMKKMNHPHIITYYDVIKKPDYWYIIMEHCNYGTLEDVIKYNKKLTDSFGDTTINLEYEAHYYLNQLKNALNYIRKLGYVHRDIKPQNILLVNNSQDPVKGFVDLNLDLLFDSDLGSNQKNYHSGQKLIVKLADFGLAKYTDTKDLMSKTICGTPFYMAPELLIDGEYNSKVDLWSFGVIMYEMLFHTYPIEATTLAQLKIKMQKLDINFHIDGLTKKCFDLLIRLLNKNHKVRINWEDFFNHEWFMHWKQASEPNFAVSNETGSLELMNGSADSIPRRSISSGLSRMKFTRYDTNNIPGTYGDFISEFNTAGIPITRPFPKSSNITKSISMPSRTNRGMSDNISISDLSDSGNKYPNSCPSNINKSGIIRSSYNPTTIIEDYNNPISVRSNPIVIQQPKVSYAKSALSYIMSPISYISGSYNSPNNR